MDHAGFGAERRPAAFRLDLAMHGVGARPLDAGAGALRHLEEAVLQGLRADGDRLEQRVVAGIARHGFRYRLKTRRDRSWLLKAV